MGNRDSSEDTDSALNLGSLGSSVIKELDKEEDDSEKTKATESPKQFYVKSLIDNGSAKPVSISEKEIKDDESGTVLSSCKDMDGMSPPNKDKTKFQLANIETSSCIEEEGNGTESRSPVLEKSCEVELHRGRDHSPSLSEISSVEDNSVTPYTPSRNVSEMVSTINEVSAPASPVSEASPSGDNSNLDLFAVKGEREDAAELDRSLLNVSPITDTEDKNCAAVNRPR